MLGGDLPPGFQFHPTNEALMMFEPTEKLTREG
jgi:hypothetical protein